MSLSFTIGQSTITVFLDGEINTVDDSHLNYTPLLTELRKEPEVRDMDNIRTYVSIQRTIERETFGDVMVDADGVYYKGTPITGYLATRMLEIIQQGIGIEPWALFMGNVMRNPSDSAREELYQWLEKGQLPLTPDGHFIGFKKVKSDYTDCHSGQFDNSVGCILEMDRALCDPNRHNHCSTGFHFASVGYLSHFRGQRVMAVKINPRDVTAIPADYQTTKGRCSRYEVVAELQDHHAAENGAWSQKPVVDLEDPQEFPDLLIKPAEPPQKKRIKSDGNKPVKTRKVADKKKPDGAIARVLQRIKDGVFKGTRFTTTTGKSFTPRQVAMAIKQSSSTREAARTLEIGESTLRGWKGKLGL